MTRPSWLTGCPGRPLPSVDAGYQAFAPSLTGLHQFDRVSRKDEDKGKTKCLVCGAPPARGHGSEAWELVLEADRIQEEDARQRKIARYARNGYSG